MTIYQRSRLAVIDYLLHCEGGFRRAAIRDVFGITLAQISKDIAEYERRWPDKIRYDKRRKRYVQGKDRWPALPPKHTLALLSGLRVLADRGYWE